MAIRNPSLPPFTSSMVSDMFKLPSTIHTVAHHPVIDLPGGPFVMGSPALRGFGDAPSHWSYVRSFKCGVGPVTERLWREVMEYPGNEKAPEDHPVTHVPGLSTDWKTQGDGPEKYCDRLMERYGTEVRLLTEAEQEYIRRGPAVNLTELMRKENVDPSDFREFVEGRFENFVRQIRLGARIYNNLREKKAGGELEEFLRILEEGQPLYCWPVYGTLADVLHDNASLGIGAELVNSHLMTVPVDEGGPNGFGIKGIWNVREWTNDWYDRETYTRNRKWVDPKDPGKGEFRQNPKGPDRDPRRHLYRVLRGGPSYIKDRMEWGHAYRGRKPPYWQYGNIGFRIAVDHDPDFFDMGVLTFGTPVAQTPSSL